MKISSYKTYRKQDLDHGSVQIQPGNFIVTRGHDFFDRLMQVFTQSPWNHAALIIDAKGTIIELTTTGIKKNHLSEYKKQDMYIIAIDMSNEDRQQVVNYAEVMLQRHATYGFLTIASIVFKILTTSRLVIKLDGTLICSEFVAKALSQGGIIWDKDTSLITPADLYNKFVRLD